MIDRINQHVPDTKDGSRSKGSCAYLGENNARCAVGAMLSTEDLEIAHRGYEGGGPQHLPYEIRVKYPLPEDAMEELQNSHDSRYDHEATARQRVIDWINANVEDGE